METEAGRGGGVCVPGMGMGMCCAAVREYSVCGGGCAGCAVLCMHVQRCAWVRCVIWALLSKAQMLGCSRSGQAKRVEGKEGQIGIMHLGHACCCSISMGLEESDRICG